MSTPGPIEEELKIPVDDLEAVRTRVEARGASLQVPRQLEDNAVLDTPTMSLLGSGRLLRLRRWGDEVLLTFKGPASYDRHVKSRLELETHVADGERMLGILAELGWTPQRRYQKWRETLAVGHRHRRPRRDPDRAASWRSRARGTRCTPPPTPSASTPRPPSSASYQELWQRWRQAHPGAPRDMVFPGLE